MLERLKGLCSFVACVEPDAHLQRPSDQLAHRWHEPFHCSIIEVRKPTDQLRHLKGNKDSFEIVSI